MDKNEQNHFCLRGQNKSQYCYLNFQGLVSFTIKYQTCAEWYSGVNSINVKRAFFIQKFVQSQKVTRKKAFVQKIRAFNVDEIDHR